jgi:hypothetical protein
MNKFSTLILSVIWIVGTILTLIQLYASADGLQYPFTASLYYLGTSLIMTLVVIKFRNEVSKKAVIMNNLIITIFTVESILLALICFYSLEPQTRVESLASSIFFLAGMVVGSSVFFVSSKVQNSTTISNKNVETNSLP